MFNLIFTCLACFLPFLPFAANYDKAQDVVVFGYFDFAENQFVEKKAFTNQQYLYLTTYDLVNPSNVLATIEALSENSSLPTATGTITGQEFATNGGTILLNSSSIKTAVTFYIDNIGYQGQNDLQYRGDFALDYIQYIYTIIDSNHKSFEINIGCHNQSFNYINTYKTYQLTEVLSGQLQQSWTCYVESLQGSTPYSSSRLIYCFNQNVTYDYFRLGDDSYDSGYRNGYSVGFVDGKSWADTQEYNGGYADGYEVGKQEGYQEGIQYMQDSSSTASTIFTGILDVGLLPVNVFLSIFNFEVFGINISGFISALLTISIVIIIVRFLFGGSKNDK